MTEGPFGLPRPFAESKPVLRVVIDESEAPNLEDKDELYSDVLFDFESRVGFQKADSIVIGSNKEDSFSTQHGMVNFGYDLSSLNLENVSDLHKSVDGVFEDYETFIEVR